MYTRITFKGANGEKTTIMLPDEVKDAIDNLEKADFLQWRGHEFGHFTMWAVIKPGVSPEVDGRLFGRKDHAEKYLKEHPEGGLIIVELRGQQQR